MLVICQDEGGFFLGGWMADGTGCPSWRRVVAWGLFSLALIYAKARNAQCTNHVMWSPCEQQCTMSSSFSW